MTTTQNTNAQINTPTQRLTNKETELQINRKQIAYSHRNLPAGLFDIDGYMIKPPHMWTEEEEVAYDNYLNLSKTKKAKNAKMRAKMRSF